MNQEPLDRFHFLPDGTERSDYVIAVLALFRPSLQPEIKQVLTERFASLACEMADRTPQTANLTAALRSLHRVMLEALEASVTSLTPEQRRAGKQDLRYRK